MLSNGGYKSVEADSPGPLVLVDYDKMVNDYKKYKNVDKKSSLLRGVQEYLLEVQESYLQSISCSD